MIETPQLTNLSIPDLIGWLRGKNIRRFYFVHDPKQQKVLPSHPELHGVAKFLESASRDFSAHEGLFFQITKQHDTLQGAFIHNTVRGQGAGGTRFWQYGTFEDYLKDGLRLSKGMTRKNSLAGIWWGGGKGVIAENPNIEKTDAKIRASIFQEYGELVSSINGCYVTAEDVGTNVIDMANIFRTTRFMTCIPETLGGSGNPSAATAQGVVCGMEAALKFLFDEKLDGKKILVQGMGNVGAALIRFLFEKNVAKVVAYDINAHNVEHVRIRNQSRNLEAHLVGKGDTDFLQTECDIFAPCATGAILNQATIPELRVRLVCGAANNQLEDAERDDHLLQEHGIVYVPDFLANRMGIVNCSNEQYGKLKHDPAIEQHLSMDWEHSVYQTTVRVLKESKETGEPPAKVATRQADRLAEEPHPIFGHRGKRIIDSLLAEGWGLDD